ncbi:hypothetical protein Pfo_013873 [Paulownia fortunei]|nr:hypothetical protein Pfo_013873 [Paulownia fortunei]
MAQRGLSRKKIDKAQNHEDPFAVKPFYDMVHSNSYIKPTYFTMNVSSSGPEDELNGDTEIKPTSNASASAFGGKRFFEITLAKCYANYLFSMRLPHRVGSLLPSSDFLATFKCYGKSYKVKFFGQRRIKMFGSGWRQFVEEHNLVEGDHLIFEVIKTSDRELELNIQILRRTLSHKSKKEKRGKVKCPIIIDVDDE